jgi:hypothetical protein
MSKILSYVSLMDLKQFRLVCKTWDELCQNLIKDKLTVHFISNRKMKAYSRKMLQRKGFCERFALGSGPRISLSSPITQEFFKDFGHHVRSLDVNCSNQSKLYAFKFILCHYLPNLEELSIRTTTKNVQILSGSEMEGQWESFPYFLKLQKLTVHVKDEIDLVDSTAEDNNGQAFNFEKKLIQFLRELILSSPNLQQIESSSTKLPIPNSGKSGIDEINDLTIDSFTVLSSPDKISSQLWSILLNDWDVSLLKMKKLSFGVTMSDECVQKLATKWFHLSTINLKLEPNVTSNSLKFLFSSLKDTLQIIKLNFSSVEATDAKLETETELFPITEVMHRVESVDVEGYRGNLRFLEFMPNLRSLILRKLRFNKTVLKDVDSTTKPHLSLLSLKVFEDLSLSTRQRSVQAVQQIGLLFPSLKKLRLEKLVDESLCLIYAQWPNIEELEIIEGQFTDAGITAIHPNAYKVILREEAYDSFNVDGLRQGLYLGNLSSV